jgi:hypothetical protein
MTRARKTFCGGITVRPGWWLAACLCAAWFPTWVGAVTAGEGKPERSQDLLENGSFEAIQRLAAPPKGNDFGIWVLKSDLQAPVAWTLSSAYPGELEVVEGDAADGQRFLRLAAGAKRAAHLYQSCPRLRPGLAYKVTLRYRGGPVELKVYEYTAQGRLDADRPFADGTATPARNGVWATLEGVYQLPEGIATAIFAVAVPEASDADLDDVRVGRFVRQGGTAINVRDGGASGSAFETAAETNAGSSVVVLKDVGDFQVGQQVAVSKCNPNVCDLRIWEMEAKTVNAYGGRNAPPETQVEVRGYDGSLGNWTVYMLDFAGTKPPTFRWSDDLTLTWKGTKVPVTGEWQKLSGGVEVKFGKRDWTTPCLVTFSGRDQLISTILKIEGSTVTLADPAPVGAKGCVMQHTDSAALQVAFDRAAAEGRDLFIPAGRYRLTRGLNLRNADGITVTGESEERTILDISNGSGSCITIKGGTSVTLRNLRFRGFSRFAERKQMGSLPLPGYIQMWGFYIKHCSAVWIQSPERILVENCHATGMSAECFYSASSSRSGNRDPARYTKSIIYNNCTVVDCARNAFNNNDMAENTAVLYCRIQDVGGCTWEGASRFVKFVGNYVRNAGTVAMGNIGSRAAEFDVLPSGQHIVAHNTFEQETPYGGCAIRSCFGSTPVIIKDNVFVNFNTSAIEANGSGDNRHLPSANTVISGNAIDLTCVRGDSRARVGIGVSADDAIVSDNQVYVRGEVDSLVKGIVLTEPARNIVVHDNIIRGCAVGLQGGRWTGRIADVVDSRTFKASGPLPLPRRRTHGYRGCRMAWLVRDHAVPGPEIMAFDTDKSVFRLSADAELKKGAPFAVYSPQGFHWSLHHNVINNCDRLVDLDVFGGPTAVFSDNVLSRGDVARVEVAVSIRGLFRVQGNQFAGFDGPQSVALMLHPDPFGKVPRFICRDNVFDRCAKPVGEGAAGVWDAAIKGGNVFGDQAEIPLGRPASTSARPN